MDRPMNPRLYRALESVFGSIDIINPGQEKPDGFPGGEEYKFNCPYCNDTRHRFQVNYRYGEYDKENGTTNEHLFHCFNDGCHEEPEIRIAFRQRVRTAKLCLGRGPSSVKAAPIAPLVPDEPDKPVTLPPGVPLCKLSEKHPAAQYIANRDFDCQVLWDSWEVYYAPLSLGIPTDAIIIPVYEPGPENQHKLVGWQARLLWPEHLAGAVPFRLQKYMTAKDFHKSRFLYNLPFALTTKESVFLCEGVTDCWRVGANSVAFLGKSMSRYQEDLVIQHLAGRPLIVCLDEDATEEAQVIQKRLQARRLEAGDSSPVIIADLPAGRKDVGDCTREEVVEMLHEALAKAPCRSETELVTI